MKVKFKNCIKLKIYQSYHVNCHHHISTLHSLPKTLFLEKFLMSENSWEEASKTKILFNKIKRKQRNNSANKQRRKYCKTSPSNLHCTDIVLFVHSLWVTLRFFMKMFHLFIEQVHYAQHVMYIFAKETMIALNLVLNCDTQEKI